MSIEELNKAAEQVKEKQEKELVIDFDQSVQGGQDIRIVFEGQDFHVGSEPSAKVTMFLLRKGKALSDEDTLTLLELIFGKAFIEALENSDKSFKSVVNGILLPVMEQWGINDSEFKEEKKTDMTPAS